ncbi:MAG TPA: sugar transferase [Nitrospira sp.]|nr:sugar transferase [Nitrospira sp.]HMV59379.1 sugar transferase [Nitrospira sp.]HMW84368.1 sugar transferase [Nitrospira sp.]HMX92480.1 sugar transferase [Nitrospira sp.]HMZ95920.1 sugar transferase [Nitrospira sp.]
MKRVFDVLCAVLGLMLLSPMLVVIALLITLGDGGSPFYRGLRVGRNGRPFRILKFRTMRSDAERSGVTSTAKDDPRVTSVGAVLRRYKLDELPQLWNVLCGEMSLVGPRPEVQRFVDLYTDEEKAILAVRPGLTDWASLWNIDEGAILEGSADPDRTYCELIRPKKIRLQLAYVRQAGFRTDLDILLRTVGAVLFRVKFREPRVLELGA